MDEESIRVAAVAARRFLRTADVVLDECVRLRRESGEAGDPLWRVSPRERGSCRRASMDLTRALAAMRRYAP